MSFLPYPLSLFLCTMFCLTCVSQSIPSPSIVVTDTATQKHWYHGSLPWPACQLHPEHELPLWPGLQSLDVELWAGYHGLSQNSIEAWRPEKQRKLRQRFKVSLGVCYFLTSLFQLSMMTKRLIHRFKQTTSYWVKKKQPVSSSWT